MPRPGRRDHRRLGQQLDLFSINDSGGAGLVFWHPKVCPPPPSDMSPPLSDMSPAAPVRHRAQHFRGCLCRLGKALASTDSLGKVGGRRVHGVLAWHLGGQATASTGFIWAGLLFWIIVTKR